MPKKARGLRLIAGRPNHIVCRGNNRRRLFSYARDYRRYLRLMESAIRQYQCRLHAICRMSNHVHLLMTPPTLEAASKLMQRVNQRYAQQHNAHRAGSGKLFEERFESDPIDNDAHLKFSVLYINANPHAAWLWNRECYPWSTHELHAGRLDAAEIWPDMITPDPWYLSLGDSSHEREMEYQARFDAYLLGDRDEELLERASRLEPKCASAARLERPDGSSAAESVSHYVKIEE